MTIDPQIPPPPESTARHRRSTLDPKRPSPRVSPMALDGTSPTPDSRNALRGNTSAEANTNEEQRRALLRAQPWGRVQAQLTAIALKRIQGRSLSEAKDLAQSAIADAYESVSRGGWNPERGPLQGYLVARVVVTAAAERRRKRTTCEVWLDEEAEDSEEDRGASRYERHLAEDKPAPDAMLHRLRFASTFDERLTARLAEDVNALALLPLMKEGLFTPLDLSAATGKSPTEVRDILRRIRYHANEITKDLSAQTAAALAPGDARATKVTQ
jgi:hypothetical protein